MSTENQKDIESTEHMFDVGVDESVDETVEGLPEISPLEPMAVLEEQVGLLKDQLMRAHAEMENVRRRAAEDVSKAHKFSIERFANELLPVQESLEKALSDTTGDLTTLREGVELTQKQLTNALEKSGVLAIDPKGEKFDPHYHQAISMVTAADAEPNTVIEVLQKGYKIADRVLRPALVIVAQG
ncbi:protein GrpE [Formosimonas limnophila]|uniref:Protein GrpE n=2 Tax=Formosimonas limnophila TaxID=1384487 RepID=A0A8J3CJM5_9BURK|nr:protein GrpE [Formosimonas limnophila]